MDKSKSSMPVLNASKSVNTATVDHSASLPPGPQHMIQNFLLIWLDANFNEGHPDFQNSIKALRRLVVSITTFTDAQKCIDFLSEVIQEKVFMIVSGSLGKQVVPEIASLSQIESIYVFCGNKAAHEPWANKISKVKGVYTEIDSICEALKMDRKTCDRNMISISFNRVDPLFMYTQLLKDAIMQIEEDDDVQIKKLVDFCQQQGGIDTDQINQVRTEYRQHTPIWWYTADIFMYSMLNRGLREMNTDIILSIQFFIRHLHKHIAELYRQQIQSSSNITRKFTVYRGQGLSTKVFEQLKKAKGELMSFNNFLSTSLNRQVSLRFANPTSNDMIGILFVMSIDSRVAEISNIPYADVSKVGYFKEKEAEILFTTHTIFRINHIQPLPHDQSNRLWEVQLTLVGNDDNELNELVTHFQAEMKGESWHRLGSILIKMGEPEKAEQFYQALLARVTTHGEGAACLGQLGGIYYSRGEYLKAAQFFERSLEIDKKVLFDNHPSLAASYNNIGLVYQKMGKYSVALEYQRKSLEILKTTLPSNHPDLCNLYNNIGSVHYSMGEFLKALAYYNKGLEISKIALPPNHPDLATSYSNIGLVYYNTGEYSKALEYHQKDLEILKTALPPHHPDLAQSYSNIGNVYNSIGEYSKAFESHQKSLVIRKIALPPNHADLAQSYIGIGNVYFNTGVYSTALEYYQKALEIRKIALPSNHPDLAESYNNIGEVHFCICNHTKSLAMHERALQVLKTNFPENHLFLAYSYNNLGLVCNKLQHYSEAFKNHYRAILIREKALPPDHPELAKCYNDIALVYTNLGKYSESLAFDERGLAIRRMKLPLNHSDLAKSYNGIGNTYEHMGEYVKALSNYLKAQEIWQKSFPNGHPHAIEVKENIERVKRKI